ncbi:hypothetical protein [Microbacterium lushaniae]|nr:hypothetical protein [Microbacterium lushaniae]
MLTLRGADRIVIDARTERDGDLAPDGRVRVAFVADALAEIDGFVFG